MAGQLSDAAGVASPPAECRAPTVYSIITEIDPNVVEQLATAMEVSAADPQHREMVEAYLAELDPPPGARVVELGCGSGAIARMSPPGPASPRSSASTRHRS